ncbi:unnamed protein product [Adineta ricciae]|uniref:B30.2/SPRY domain-containing protein n=1 Tax=Adineta ricciae TaxID=249248 RepID=A0A814V0F6_ADIRI|nr:unnamed protein product [Adineta ricciae]CAF1342106.1 unnamed protein product [Adineta ricciae]
MAEVTRNPIDGASISVAQQLDRLLLDFHQLKQSIDSEDQQSLRFIDEWERKSIEKIQQTAHDYRQDFAAKFEKYKEKLCKRSNHLHEELINTQNSGNLMKVDIQNLSNKLARLNSLVQSPPHVITQHDEFISKLSICEYPDDIFDIFAGDLRVENRQQTAIHGPSVAHAVVRGSDEYSRGKHRFRFRIESFNNNKWIFFGIISHKTTLQAHTWAVPTCYGWGGQDSVILNCAMHSRFNGYNCDFELNDTIELTLDCDQQMISIMNQRTQCNYSMKVDVKKCPFPWHFVLNLFYPGDQVRILYKDTL